MRKRRKLLYNPDGIGEPEKTEVELWNEELSFPHQDQLEAKLDITEMEDYNRELDLHPKR